MSVTTTDAVHLNTLLRALFRLSDPPGPSLRNVEAEVREAAAHLAERARRQLRCGPSAEDVWRAPLRVRI
jgi:hypothetical protein